ncbi:gluconate permease, partial [Staphylococcus sp. SIMBA_130]
PVFAKWINKRVVPVGEPDLIKVEDERDPSTLPGTGLSFTTIIMPVLLLVLGTFAPFLPLPGDAVGILECIGSALVALLLSCFFAVYFLGFRQG